MKAISSGAEIKIRRASQKIVPKITDVNTEIHTFNLLRVL